MEALKIVGRLKATNCHGRYWSVAVRLFAEASNRTDLNCGCGKKKATLALAAKRVADPTQGFRTTACSNRLLVSESEIIY